MIKYDATKQIYELEREIALLPPGSLTTKEVKGKKYYYHRVSKNQKRTEIYVPFEDVEKLSIQINKRKELEKELKKIKKENQGMNIRETDASIYGFSTYVRLGQQLYNFASPVKAYKRRECYSVLADYIFGTHKDKVFILYGLRRTGKTTLIRQILLEMSFEQLQKAAFIQIQPRDTLSALNSDLRLLEEYGYKYVFIDEITLMADFIEGAALLSDIYASSGMKIVLSGTDSLGFLFTEQEQLFDRCILLHTTLIPYREFENVLGIQGIDEYIRYGGTMSMSGVSYNETSSFATSKSTNDYVDSAIARNIQHSLQYYRDGGHFRHLYDLYAKNELTSAINRVVEDMNHRFTKQVLTKTFISNDLAISARNLLNDRNESIDILQHMDKENVTKAVKMLLEILNIEEQTIEIDEIHAYQIKEYLLLLDLIMEIDVIQLPKTSQSEKITVVTQPGLRYAQADALVKSLIMDERFNSYSIVERQYILQRILSEIKGRMMEEIVLLETKLAYPKKHVCKVQFAIGEVDMVVCDLQTLTCEIYEIKYSDKMISAQYRHLIDKDKCAQIEHHFGRITGKYVIYRGEDMVEDNVNYLNVEGYLKSLG